MTLRRNTTVYNQKKQKKTQQYTTKKKQKKTQHIFCMKHLEGNDGILLDYAC